MTRKQSVYEREVEAQRIEIRLWTEAQAKKRHEETKGMEQRKSGDWLKEMTAKQISKLVNTQLHYSYPSTVTGTMNSSGVWVSTPEPVVPMFKYKREAEREKAEAQAAIGYWGTIMQLRIFMLPTDEYGIVIPADMNYLEGVVWLRKGSEQVTMQEVRALEDHLRDIDVRQVSDVNGKGWNVFVEDPTIFERLVDQMAERPQMQAEPEEEESLFGRTTPLPGLR
jgi:hypothetical protein